MRNGIDVRAPEFFGDARVLSLAAGNQLSGVIDSIRRANTQIASEVRSILSNRRREYSRSKAVLAGAKAELAACLAQKMLNSARSCELERESALRAADELESALHLFSTAKKAQQRIEARISSYLRTLSNLEELTDSLATNGSNYLLNREADITEILTTPLPHNHIARSSNKPVKPSASHYTDERAVQPQLVDALKQWAANREQPFPSELPEILYSEQMTGFGEYDKRNRIILSSRIHSLERGFRPYNDALSALSAISGQRPLSLHQEHGLETFWHEINHARSSLGKSFLSARPSYSEENWRTLLETMVEWYSRETYPLFIADLGGKANHVTPIREQGYAYSRNVRRMRKLLIALKVSDAKAETVIADTLFGTSAGPGEESWDHAALILSRKLIASGSSSADDEVVMSALLKLDYDSFDVLLKSL